MFTTLRKVGISVLLSSLIAGVCVLPMMPVLAADTAPVTSSTGKLIQDQFSKSASSFSNLDVTSIIALIVQTILAILGIIFLILMIYGGITWMTSEGDSKKVDKARGIIFHAVIGLVITMSSYAITAFVLSRLAGITK